MSQSGGVNPPAAAPPPPVSGSGSEVNAFNWHDQLQVPRVPLRVPQNTENNKPDEKAYECLKCQMQFPSAAACISHERSGCGQQPSLMTGFGNLGIAPISHDGLAYSLGLPPPQNIERPKDVMDVMPPLAHSSHMGQNPVSQANTSMGNGMPETTKKKHKKKKKHKDGVPPPHINFTEEGRSYSAGVVLTSAGGEQGTLKYKCKICPQEYYTRSDVMLHARSHKEGKPHKCNTCGKGFATTSYLQQHIRIHSNEKPYPCAYCEKGFKQLSHLQQHTRIHTGDRPYKCDYPDCDKAFTQLANLQQHWRRHNKDKPYKCRDCYRAYDELEKLQSHVHSHANTRREKRFSCGVCGKSYAQELYLMKHMAKHPQLSGVRGELAAMPVNNTQKLNNEVTSACSTCVHKKKHKHKHKHTSPSSSASSSLPTQVLHNSLPTLVTSNFTQPNQVSGLQVSAPQATMAASNSMAELKNLPVPEKNPSLPHPPQQPPNEVHQTPHYSQPSTMEIPVSAAIATSPGMPHRGILPGHPAMFASPPQAQRLDITAMTSAGSLHSAVSMSIAASRHLHGVPPFTPT